MKKTENADLKNKTDDNCDENGKELKQFNHHIQHNFI